MGGCKFQQGFIAAADGAIDAPSDGPAVIEHDAAISIDAAIEPFEGAVVRINIEGAAHVGADHPGMWAADLGVCPGAPTLAVSAAVNQTDDDVLFQNAAVGDTVHCMIGGLPGGTYDVTLLFAEVGQPACNPAACTRVFSIALEGSTVMPAFDLIAEGGGCALVGNTGYPVERMFSVAVTDGTLDVQLAKVAGQGALLSALQAVQTGPL